MRFGQQREAFALIGRGHKHHLVIIRRGRRSKHLRRPAAMRIAFTQVGVLGDLIIPKEIDIDAALGNTVFQTQCP